MHRRGAIGLAMQDRIGEALSIYARATVRQTASTSGSGGAAEEREEYLHHSVLACSSPPECLLCLLLLLLSAPSQPRISARAGEPIGALAPSLPSRPVLPKKVAGNGQHGERDGGSAIRRTG